ncbi:Imm6 family immunity protein [Thermoactinomyces mirandus]|uniref:Immunity protein Imm6 n=1 Tax=Thermoactinomyces mirandus TaxID=2756294 RepID=A0A7W1XUD3_9BACL|nr:Imm6 family immunity protein [Thermoactinomyces mirandus]MBA4603390.1 hypothetical protein [Thermoactinomyces mirandus]
MDWFKKVNLDAKAAYYLTLSEKILHILTDYDWYSTIIRSTDMCWEWIEEKKYNGLDMYLEIADEDEGLLVVTTLIDPFSENSQAESAFWCVLDAVSYTIRQAYIFDDTENEVPQSIEPVNDEYIQREFMESIRKVDGYQEEWAEQLKKYLLENYPAGSDKKIKREELLKQIA